MKSLIITSILCTGMAHAHVYKKVAKVLDATSARCESKINFLENKLQAYKVKSFAYHNNWKNYQVEIIMNIEMLSCNETNKRYAFKEVNIYDLFTYKNYKDEEITVTTKDANIIFYRDGIYKKLAQVNIEDERHKSKIIAKFDINDLFTRDEFQRYLNGEKVKTTLDFNLNRHIEVSNDQITEEFKQSYGAFRVFLELEM